VQLIAQYSVSLSRVFCWLDLTIVLKFLVLISVLTSQTTAGPSFLPDLPSTAGPYPAFWARGDALTQSLLPVSQQEKKTKIRHRLPLICEHREIRSLYICEANNVTTFVKFCSHVGRNVSSLLIAIFCNVFNFLGESLEIVRQAVASSAPPYISCERASP
jgi:hypothetical protein